MSIVEFYFWIVAGTKATLSILLHYHVAHHRYPSNVALLAEERKDGWLGISCMITAMLSLASLDNAELEYAIHAFADLLLVWLVWRTIQRIRLLREND
ncbi:MAG TPA: hypothetical protein PK667_11010 [Nitrosomonas europaea]|uniref:hypothetical protein n=1 Tax=Nitrosomonas europaea TaxID=915 RepID=UPI002BD2A12D|nr:hypothetical protein [Nitrosomonas europaea]HUM74707.1 hypothetical protein [Nitrosomonas europaea]